MKISLNDIKVDLPAGGGTLFCLPQFEAESGQKILLQGESGRGKTTFLHLMAGLFHPTEGRVQIGEHRLSTLSDEERCQFRRRHVGIIFQKLNLIEYLSPLENVLLCVGESAIDKARKALEAVGLERQSQARSSVLSLGEQQRVAVARVLAADPAIILADEPTSSLDEKNAANVMDLLFQAAQGKTLIVVSHDHRIERKFNSVVQFDQLVRR